MVSTTGSAVKLAQIESTDPVVQIVATKVRSIMKDLGIDQQIPGLQIHFPDFSKCDFDPTKEDYYTEGCVSNWPSTVVVNAQFLLEMEAAIRSFGLFDVLLSTPYLRSDASMFGLVKRIREDGKDWLEKLRKFEDGQKSTERSGVDELTMTALFFCAHEVGHLNDGVKVGQYAAFLDPSKPLETRLANAAVRFRRHASEFEHYGFGLPGWQGAVTPEHEAYTATEKLRAPIATEDEDSAQWFKLEISADDAAVQLMIGYLKGRPARDRWLLVRSLFAAAIYAWYKDLLAFCVIVNPPRSGTRPNLSFAFMMNPEAYISAASLFGDFHRCTILRSTLGIQAILDADRNDGDAAAAKGSKTFLGRVVSFWDKLCGAKTSADDRLEQNWKWESAQRHILLAIHLDTLVKLSYVGAHQPYMINKETERGSPQALSIQFESIDMSVSRLREVIDKART